jgi:hypothetical protein
MSDTFRFTILANGKFIDVRKKHFTRHCWVCRRNFGLVNFEYFILYFFMANKVVRIIKYSACNTLVVNYYV